MPLALAHQVHGDPMELRAMVTFAEEEAKHMHLHLEWMIQLHYVDSVRADEALDPQFCSLLRHHWMEEAQHAKLDTLIPRAP